MRERNPAACSSTPRYVTWCRRGRGTYAPSGRALQRQQPFDQHLAPARGPPELDLRWD